MDIKSTIIRALDNFQGDVEAGVIEDVSLDDIRAAREWARRGAGFLAAGG